MFIMLI